MELGVGVHDHFSELSIRLRKARDWVLLKALWAGVIAKRRTNYNKTKRARSAVPDKIPEELLTRTRELLLESLRGLQSCVSALDRNADIAESLAMIERKIKA